MNYSEVHSVTKTFFRELVGAHEKLVRDHGKCALYEIESRLESFLRQNIKNVDCVYDLSRYDLRMPTKNQVSTYKRLILWLRHKYRTKLSYEKRAKLARNNVLNKLKTILVSPVNNGKIKEERAPIIQKLSQLSDADIDRFVEIILASCEQEIASACSSSERIKSSSRNVLFVSHLFATTWAPTAISLRGAGYKVFWLGRDPVLGFTGYGALDSHEVPVDGVFHESFIGNLVFMSLVKRKCKILLSGECYYGSNWSATNTAVLYYLLSSVAASLHTVEGPKNFYLLMYDGLKPFSADPTKIKISYLYSKLVNSCDGIIFNSNTEYFGEYVANTYGVKSPILHFYRYSFKPDNPKPRIPMTPPTEGGDPELHMACITVVLSEFYEPSRDDVSGYIIEILRQKIHFHYYCDLSSKAVLQFIANLSKEERIYFHPHTIIKDQMALINELHQYHLALNPSDHIPFSKGIANLIDRDYQDGMATFWQSTIGTSFAVYAAAGLPFVLPRGCSGGIAAFPEAAIPMYLSEYKGMGVHLRKVGIWDILKSLEGGASSGHIETHINRLVEFIE